MELQDILVVIAPSCVLYSAFAYFKTVALRKNFAELEQKLITLAQDNAVDIANLQRSISSVSLEVDKVRTGFITERTCPGCGKDRKASDYAEGDYICQECREEKYTDADGDEFQIHP